VSTISLANRVAIHELIAEYSHRVDNYRGEEWADLFLEDGQLLGIDNPLLGRQAFIDKSNELKAGDTEYRHIITNVFVARGATDEQATVSAYGTVVNWTETPPVMAIFAEYRFELVKPGEQWKIARLHVHKPYEA